jgi:hypothetical protein
MGEQTGGEGRRGGVPPLVIPLEPGRRVTRDVLTKLLADGRDTRALLRRNPADGGFGLRRHATKDNWPALLDDARLLGGDLADRVPEHVAMVHANRRDNADLGVDDVGGVQPAPEANLDHAAVAVATLKLEERHRRHELEERRPVKCVALGADLLRDGLEL